MQLHSFADDVRPGLIVHPDRRADRLKRRMLAGREDVPRTNCVSRTVDYLEQIALILCQHARAHIVRAGGARAFVPLLVLRGGLVMRPAIARVFPRSPVGLVVPFRQSSLEEPVIVYGDVPVPSQRDQVPHYLVADLLLATGSTVVAALDSVYARVGPVIGDDFPVAVLAPFAATVGIQAVLARFPDVVIHAIWHREQVDQDRRMVGPGFDIGDYALGGECARRVRWACQVQA
ncbi:MAG TPA: hypothetical protein ENN19_19120 [Chloroflexi bacterium]|nr:hypothetical protein [Chloroflexota bacterium]